MMEALNIRQAAEEDISSLYDLYAQIGQKSEGYFEEVLEKDCVVLIAHKGDQDIGFGILNFEPKYSLYQKLEIPEIQDLNVIPEARRQGVATSLIGAFENMASDQGVEQIGISVGLTKDYGPAQRLYTKLGYMPDGNGISYDRQGVELGRSYPVVDDLCLMMIKSL
ncbi:MAG: GNAT family N-acetyltransferase [Alphaproteobacteria bacterium]|nr:GNAT family N-acetyltransferase [Alphaproteobacteria bacterium]